MIEENILEKSDKNEDIIIKYLTDYLNDSEQARFRELISTSSLFRKELSQILAALAITDSVIDKHI